MHGLWLAASNALKALHTIQDAKISIEAVYLGCDALSQMDQNGFANDEINL